MLKNVKASLAAFFAAAAAADPELRLRTHNEAYPDLGLPRPTWIQDGLMSAAQAKRERKAGRYYTKTLENGRTILQQRY